MEMVKCTHLEKFFFLAADNFCDTGVIRLSVGENVGFLQVELS